MRYEDAPFPAWRVGRAVRYLAKYWRKRPSAPAAVVEHFERVHRASQAPAAPAADFTLAAVGDVLWMRRGWEDFISPPVAEALRADVVFGNLETPVSSSRRVVERRPDVLRENAPPALVETLARHGFTALSLVNNHCLDQGEAGLRETPIEVRRRGIAAIEAGRCEVVERRGLKVAFLAFMTFLNRIRGVSPPPGAVVPMPSSYPSPFQGEGRVRVEARGADERRPLTLPSPRGGEGSRPPGAAERERFLEAVAAARAAGADLVVVSAHWGHEFEFFPDPRQMAFARELARAGADVILGHHPHVLQPMEFLTRVSNVECRMSSAGRSVHSTFDTRHSTFDTFVPVLYSLGNFASVMYSIPCRLGVVARLGFSLSGARPAVTSVEFVPTLVHVRRGLRTLVVPLDEAESFGVRPRRAAKARALFDSLTPRILVPPG